MKAIGIVGSPRKNGNTEILTRHTLEVIAGEGLKTELITLAGLDIQLCKQRLAILFPLARLANQPWRPQIVHGFGNLASLVAGEPARYFVRRGTLHFSTRRFTSDCLFPSPETANSNR